MDFVKELTETFEMNDVENLEGNIHMSNERALCVQFVTPHSGTDNQWMVRADFKETFDRWANAFFEEFFSNEDEFKEVVDKLKAFESQKEQILKEELEEME